jgi:type IV pilus assembly protein PilO
VTNLQQDIEQRDAGPSPATLKRLWLWAPIGLGGTIAALLLLALALPQGMAIHRDLQRMAELEVQRQERDLLKQQALKLARDLKLAKRQQQDIIRMVTGKGDSATFLATLDLEALAAKVKLRLYEPIAAAAVAKPQAGGGPPPAPAGGGAPPPAPPQPGQPTPAGNGAPAEAVETDPLRQAGLRERHLVLTVSGTYPQILNFLRRMERLEVLVEQKDLQLTLAGVGPERTPRDPEEPLPYPYVPEVEVKLSITLYSKAAKEPPQGKDPTKTEGPPS